MIWKSRMEAAITTEDSGVVPPSLSCNTLTCPVESVHVFSFLYVLLNDRSSRLHAPPVQFVYPALGQLFGNIHAPGESRFEAGDRDSGLASARNQASERVQPWRSDVSVICEDQVVGKEGSLSVSHVGAYISWVKCENETFRTWCCTFFPYLLPRFAIPDKPYASR